MVAQVPQGWCFEEPENLKKVFRNTDQAQAYALLAPCPQLEKSSERERATPWSAIISAQRDLTQSDLTQPRAEIIGLFDENMRAPVTQKGGAVVSDDAAPPLRAADLGLVSGKTRLIGVVRPDENAAYVVMATIINDTGRDFFVVGVLAFMPVKGRVMNYSV